MSKEFYDKYGKLIDCFSCNCIEPCSKSDSPLCSEGYVFWAKDKISDLEFKLAEKEKQIEELKGERLKFYTDDVRQTQVINGVHFDIEQLLVFSEYVEHDKWVISNRDKEIAELKQQLAEKEEERHEEWKTGKEWKWEWQKVNQQLEQANQEKISFCIEQLEKVKEFVKETSGIVGHEWRIDRFRVLEQIDNQIKAIKEMK